MNNTIQNYTSQYRILQIVFELGKIIEYSKIEKQYTEIEGTLFLSP